MTDQDNIEEQSQGTPSNKRRNLILGLILAVAALGMYASIFFRLSTNPLQ